jgi:hypothetical protein
MSEADHPNPDMKGTFIGHVVQWLHGIYRKRVIRTRQNSLYITSTGASRDRLSMETVPGIID